MDFDIIVVGARCAGSATANLLARQGHKVLLVDRGEFPSDMKASTHLLWQSGVARLDRWGLLEKLRATGCPAMKTVSLDLGEMALSGSPPPSGAVDEAFAPRRTVLDHLLVEAATEAGAQLRTHHTFKDVIRRDGRVCGVQLEDADGKEHEVHAALVVGADGRGSHVARAVDAEVLQEHPSLGGVVWAYFSDLELDDIEFFSRPSRMGMAWGTNDGLSLAGICFPQEDFQRVSKDLDVAMPKELKDTAPTLAERAAGAKRETPWMAGSVANFIRKASGPGWALVGDAGVTMDPITAAGISNAFRDAELLAEAVGASPLSDMTKLDASLASFEEQRNAASMPLYSFACDVGKLAPPTEDVIKLFVGLAGNQAATNDYFGVFAQTVPVAEFFAPENLGRIIGG